jgi:hypothetical protein
MTKTKNINLYVPELIMIRVILELDSGTASIAFCTLVKLAQPFKSTVKTVVAL